MLCDNSWIDISWDGLPNRQGPENISVKFNSKAKQLLPFADACDRVAHQIHSQYSNLYLAMSGGSDSENIANVLLRNNIPFTPIMLTYETTQFNDQKLEMWWAQQWCKKHQITPLIIDVEDYAKGEQQKAYTLHVKPRLGFGIVTQGKIIDTVEKLGGNLLAGFQLEYYPDYEQMEYLRPVLGDYNGFVMEEADNYIETMMPDRHPWAFYYWNPEIMSSFINEWDTNLTMQENKAKIYNTTHRPKFVYHRDVFDQDASKVITRCKKYWGTRDCALLGTKEHLLSQLLE